MRNDTRDITLVLGGTGKTGRRIVERLKARDLPVRVGSRTGEPPFEWKDRATWGPVLKEVDAVYVAYYPDLTVPGAADDIGAFADADDIADVAVAALTGDGHTGATYEISGRRAVTFAGAVAEIAAAAGRKVAFVPVTAGEFAAALRANDVPEDVIELLIYLFTTVLDGRNARPADGVRRALGREARDFAGFARHAAATGVWEVRS